MLIYYKSNAYFIMASWQVLGVSTTMYIIVNTKEQCARYPKKTAMTIGLINGLFDASAGIFLLFKETLVQDFR